MTKSEFNAALDLQHEIDRVETNLDNLRSTGGLKSVCNSNTPVMGGEASTYPGQLVAEIDQEIQDLKAKQTVERTIIQRFIDKQTLEETERKLLCYRYVECMTWKDVALRLGYGKRHVFKMHSRALEKMALYGT